MKRNSFFSIVVASLAAVIIGCGGNGSQAASGPPVADPPNCSFNISAVPVRPQLVGGGGAGIMVPASSLPQDLGVAHTNHLVLARVPSGRAPSPQGLSPDKVRTAYEIPANLGSGAIAIIDAFHYPTALNDFNVFATQFNLPTETSGDVTAGTNQVLQVISATGTVPTVDAAWSQEAALDIEWAHAIAPNAKIFLIEAASSKLTDLMVAVDLAKTLPGVTQISMSFGGDESGCLLATYDSHFVQGGVTFFAAAGDVSGAHDFPATSGNVIAVGGTTLNVASDGTWVSETAWSSTGGAKSSFEPRPGFQNSVASIVTLYRGTNDISAVGDPNTGVSVYDSTPYQGASAWLIFGGTSVATPIIAAMSNVSGNSRQSSQALGAILYGGLGSAHFHDITSGKSGTVSAAAGWDYLSGVGSPKGLGGF